jgi:predicted permease
MNLWQDLRLAGRRLARDRGFAVVAVVTLALGIGANALVFGTARALVLRPLPIPDPGNAFFLQLVGNDNHSFPNYLDFRDRSAEWANLAAYRVTEAAVDPGSGARPSWGYLATGNYFEMLGVQPAVGRFFTQSEDVGRNVSPYIVLSHDYWTTVFNGDRTVAGRAVRINGRPYTILGVGPRGFHGTEVFFRPDFWVPMTMAPQLEGANWIESRTAHNVYVAGRLRDGVSRAQAAAALSTVATRLAIEYPRANRDMQVTLTAPGLFGDLLRTPMTAFMGVTLVLALLVLVAACTNLASLLAARVVDRFRELAVRLALGATRRQIARQLFVETLLLCMAGGAAGMAVAFVLLRALTRWRPALGVPLAIDVLPDFPVFGFAAAISIGAALLAVGAAARRAWRADPSSLMRGPADGIGIGRWGIRDALLGVQIAVCSLLVISCLVSIRGLERTLETRLGLNPDGVVVASFDLNQAGYARVRGQAFRGQVIESIAAVPGVEGVTFTSSIPLTTDQSTDAVVSDRAVESTETPGVDANAFIVPPGYFDVMETRLLAGRDFFATDGMVAIINETLAKRLFGTADVVGRGIRRAPGQPLISIVGIAEDGTYAMPGEAPRPAVYWLALQNYRSGTQLLIRSRLPQEQVATLVREAVANLDPVLPVAFQGSFRDVTSLAFLPAKAAAVILGAFGLLAMVLALSGIYGLASYSVSARTREIGIRVAVGGRSRQVLGAVLGRTGVVLMAGGASGVLLAIAASPLLSMVVYQASSADAVILAAGAGTMVLIGLTAAWAPARRALRIDPAVTLRES